MLDSRTLYEGSVKKFPPGDADAEGIWRAHNSSQWMWRGAGQFHRNVRAAKDGGHVGRSAKDSRQLQNWSGNKP